MRDRSRTFTPGHTPANSISDLKFVDSPPASAFKSNFNNGEGSLNSSPEEEYANGTSTADLKAIPEHSWAPKRGVTLFGTDPTCIPPITAGRKRTIVLCFDGTGDQFDADITNVAKIFSMLKKDDKNHQMCYYQAGIGTQLNRHVSLPGLKTFYKSLDAAVGNLLSTHVQDGYEFLMQHHIAGDRVILFGFSRGAYTARALAGMLHKVGLLPAGNKQQVPYAWRMYKDTSDNGWELSRQFKDSFCSDVNIDFIGVFDTVSSIGFLGRRLPFTGSNRGIRCFRHAMALDERRARFKVNHWSRIQEHEDKGSMKRERAFRKGHENAWKERDDVETDVQEVWFAGGHCDVGGGNVGNNEPYIAANIPLRWMIREVFRCDTGVLWDIARLKKIAHLDFETLYPEVIISIPAPERPIAISEESEEEEEKEHHHHHGFGHLHLHHGNGNGNGHHKQDSSSSRGTSFSKATVIDIPDDDDDDEAALLAARHQTIGQKGPLDGHEHVHGYRVYNDNEHELHDALSPVFDQLSKSPIWWILELFPVKGKKQIEEDLWKEHYFVNLGRGRIVPKLSKGMHVHRSVKLRLKKGTYTTRAIYDQDPTWVL